MNKDIINSIIKIQPMSSYNIKINNNIIDLGDNVPSILLKIDFNKKNIKISHAGVIEKYNFSEISNAWHRLFENKFRYTVYIDGLNEAFLNNTVIKTEHIIGDCSIPERIYSYKDLIKDF